MDLLCGKDDVMNVFQMLIFQILLRLPVRSLLRFRSVCKGWCELIDSGVFRDTYLALRRAMAVYDQLIILETINIPNDDLDVDVQPVSITCRYGDYQSVFCHYYYYYDSAPSSSCCNDFEISGNFSNMTWIINHLDGVVCFIDECDYWLSKFKKNNNKVLGVTLLNPALREIRKLRFPVFDLLGGIFKRRLQGIGFGHDDSSNEYKVVAIVTVYEDEEGYGAPCKHIAMVYHLSTNSWTILDDIYEFMSQPLVSIYSFQQSVFSHGSLHWCIHGHDDDVGPETKYRILAFDVTSESFREMPFPRGYIYHPPYDNDAMIPRLFKVDKSTIALVASTILPYAKPVVEVWVMKEYGDNDSWIKRCRITNLPESVKPVCFLNQDEILLYTHHSDLLCYDLYEMQVVDGIATPESVHAVNAVTGHESFVSVKQV